MTDKEKLDKLVAEIERLYNQSLADENREVDRGVECAANVSYGKSRACKELLSFIDTLQKEPISEEFEKALAEEWQGYVDRGAATVDALEDNTQELAFAKGFYRGANWQKEQLLAKAVDGEVTYDKSLAIPSLGYRLDKERLDFGDKVKVIIIKKE